MSLKISFAKMALPPATVRRLANEVKFIEKNPYDNIKIRQTDTDPLVWYFCIYGLPQKPYTGYYLGRIKLPNDYPMKPPVICVITPNGRFAPEKNLCINGMSHYHPESWNPSWNLQQMIIGLISFFYDNPKEQKE